jgi:hypothetical protein
MPNFNLPRYTRIFAQTQSGGLLAINNTTGVWTSAGAQMIRADAGSFTANREAPYSRIPYLTGTRSEQPGVRGRKSASWSIRGLALIPSGVAGTVPDMDPILQNIFGQASAIVASTSATYTFSDTGYLPFTLLVFPHGSSTLTARVLWGCIVQRATINFDEAFITIDLEGQAGWMLDNVNPWTSWDAIAKAGLTAFPVEPASPTVNGQPIAGFGTGYTATFTTTAAGTGFTGAQSLEMKLKSASLTINTGLELVTGLYGSPYAAAIVGGARQLSISATALDDDSVALNALKAQCDQDNITMGVSITAGTVAGSIITPSIKAVQANAFNIQDNGNMVDFSLGESFAHASNINAVDDGQIAFT